MRARRPHSPADHSRCEEFVPWHLSHVRHRATAVNPSRGRGRVLCHSCPRLRKESIHHRVCVATSRSSYPDHSPWPHGLSAAPPWPGCSTGAHRRSPGECWGRARGCRHPECTQSSCSSLMKQRERKRGARSCQRPKARTNGTHTSDSYGLAQKQEIFGPFHAEKAFCSWHQCKGRFPRSTESKFSSSTASTNVASLLGLSASLTRQSCVDYPLILLTKVNL